VTLSGGLAAAALDPVLILWLDLGLEGAAIASILSRFTLTVVGLWGVVRVHRLAAPPSLAGFRRDIGPLSVIAVPAVLTNVATPVGNTFVTAAIASFGDSAVAGWAVIGRLLPLAFGAIFALSGSVGPILGQNYGARRHDRLRGTIHASLGFTLVYTLLIWLILALGAGRIVAAFGLSGEGAALVHLFCVWISGSFLFNGALFVANATFNNLGRPAMSTLFNWGKATIGTLPFVWLGAQWGGASGVLIGQAVGGVLFGVFAVIACYRVIDAIAAGLAADPPAPLATALPSPAEVPAGAAERPPTH
jgi:Na+-driven multidrug efflux pump